MEYGQFYASQFITNTVMNQQTTNAQGNFQDLALGRGLPGLISPTAVSYAISGLSVTATLPLPFQVLFGTGVLSQAYGTVNGANTQTYTASFSGVVPASGSPSITAYLVTTYQQIQQNPIVIIGPPQGHPDYNPNFQPYTAYLQVVDSVNLFATATPPDNVTSFELFRVSLASGATGLGTLNTAFQEWASSLSDMPINNLNAPGTLSTQTMNNITVGGTYIMPNASSFNSNFLSITCNTASLVTIESPNNIYGYFGQGATAITMFGLPQGGTIDFEAINGTWQIIGGNPLGMGVPVAVYPFTVPQGGTGLTTLPAHTVLLGEGTSAIGDAGPGGVGIPLIGQGNTADPVFGAINLNSGAVTNVLQLDNGGTNNAGSYAPYSVICLNSNSGAFTGVASGNVGVPFVSNGGSTLPSFQPLDLSLGGTSVDGTLPVGNGGTNNTSFTPYGVILARSDGVQLLTQGVQGAGTVLMSNGIGTYPSFQNVTFQIFDESWEVNGTYTVTVPSWAGLMAVWIWGGGGGGSGSNQGGPSTVGASGGGGGFTSSFNIVVSPGSTVTIVVGAGGLGASNGSQAGTGGTSSVQGTGFYLYSTGGGGANSGPGGGGVGAGGAVVFTGQSGFDLDSSSLFFAVGGACAQGAGGGSLNAGGAAVQPQVPGGGGGANYYQANGQNGANGAVRIVFFPSVIT